VTTQTEQLLKAWVPIGYRILRETAERYDGIITSSELAARVQSESGRDGGARATWIGQLLELVAMQAARTEDAPLASLCVQSDLSVGERYRRILSASGVALGTSDEDLDERAATDRLECYRRYAADLPEDGGRPHIPARTPRTRSTSSVTRSTTRKPDRPAPAVCPSCFMQLPATGTCDNCG